MKITLNCISALEALARLAKITNADHANLTIIGKDIWFSGSGQQRAIRVLVQGEIHEKGEGFGFNAFSMHSILRGRVEIVLTHKKSILNFESKDKRSSFSGNFQTIPFEEIEVVQDDGSHKVKLGGLAMTALQECVNRVSITNVMTSEPMTLWVKADKTGVYATVYDNDHCAFASNTSVTTKGKIDFSIPVPLWALVNEIAAGEDYDLSIGPVYVSASGLGFELSVPSLQVTGADKQNFDDAYKFIMGVEKSLEKADTLKISFADLMQTLDGISAVSDGVSGIKIECKGKVPTFSLESSFGSAKGQAKEAKTKEWKNTYLINSHLFRDLLGRYGSDDLEVKFTKDMLVFVDGNKNQRSVYSCLLLQ